MSQQPTEQTPPIPPEVVGAPISINELTALLIKHYGLKEGLYTPMIEFMVGVGDFGPSPQTVAPGAFLGVAKIGLVKATSPTVLSVDASQVKKTRGKRKAEK